jgi:hypothetical protein
MFTYVAGKSIEERPGYVLGESVVVCFKGKKGVWLCGGEWEEGEDGEIFLRLMRSPFSFSSSVYSSLIFLMRLTRSHAVCPP